MEARFLGCEIKGVDPEPVEGKLQGITLNLFTLGSFCNECVGIGLENLPEPKYVGNMHDFTHSNQSSGSNPRPYSCPRASLPAASPCCLHVCVGMFISCVFSHIKLCAKVQCSCFYNISEVSMQIEHRFL